MNCNQKNKKPETEKEEYTRSMMWASPQQVLNFKRLKAKELPVVTDLFKSNNNEVFEALISNRW